MTHPSGNVATDDYVWDQGASLPQVLQDANTVNGVASTTTYLYGLNGLLATTDGGGTTRYYLQDGLGSTAQLTDTGGSVTDSYTYDVFGATTHTGTGTQPFTYTGQQQDASANRGLMYLRARMYDPALGRFLTKDPIAFGQRYAYAGNSPVMTGDPSGLCGWHLSVGNALDCAKKAASHTSNAADVALRDVGNTEWDGVVARRAGRSTAPTRIVSCNATTGLRSVLSARQ
jgi:RHS repeat-associated protein